MILDNIGTVAVAVNFLCRGRRCEYGLESLGYRMSEMITTLVPSHRDNSPEQEALI
jgi:hypothetical protein